MPLERLVAFVVVTAISSKSMIDQAHRKRTRQLLKNLALGRTTNYECENDFMDMLARSKDPVIFALFRTVRELSGDAEQRLSETFSRGGQMRKRLCRWILFLQTDLEYEWPKERLAPGLRDFYKPSWLDKLFGISERTNFGFCSRGEYRVWPFFRESDFNAIKASCAQRKLVRH
jgi:hypothetical protein